MKYNIFKNLLLGAALVASLSSCDENSWNKDYLEGFEEYEATNVQTVEMTIPTADYARIARLSKNIAIAKNLDSQNGGGDTYLTALAAVANGYFSELAPASTYAPAYLDSLTSVNAGPLIGLSNSSFMKLTYETSANSPEIVAGVCSSKSYTVTEADYQTVWDSETDYVEAFAPSKKASVYVPRLLKTQFPDAVEGDYAIVTYNEASQDPIFNTGGGEQGGFTRSSVIGTATAGQDIDIAGVIMAVGSQGFLVEDASGSIVVYMGSSFDYASYSVGDQIKVSGTVSYRSSNSYNQLTLPAGAGVEVVGKESVSYPAPVVYGDEQLDNLIADMVTAGYEMKPVYASMTGELSVSGSYYNLILQDASTAQGSVLWATSEVAAALAPLDGQRVTLTGYIVSRSSSRYINMIIVESGAAASALSVSRSVSVSSDEIEAVYTFTGGAWTPATDVTLLQKSDYEAMGVSDLNATNIYTYLPIYLKNKFPYAQPEDVEYVAYKFYDSVTKTTTVHCSECTFDGSEWVFSPHNIETAQFALVNHSWVWDPSVTLTFPAGRNLEPSMSFFQACTNWVYENVDVPQFGSTSITSGVGYVTTYGNNEYYSGCSAYQGNIDLRAASARRQCPSDYENLTDEEVVAKMKARFETEVCPAVLSQLYSDAAPIEGIELLYTINFVVYNGSSSNHTIVYKVVARGTFEFVSCTWNE